MGKNKNKLRQELLRFNNLSRKRLQDMFNTEEKAYEFFVQIFWPDGPVCPYCGSHLYWSINCHDRKEPTLKCVDCRKTYTFKTGSILSHTKLNYFTWIEAIYYVVNTKRGFSSYTLAEYLGVTEKTAWHILMRIFQALDVDMNQPFDNDAEVEIDEVYLSAKVTIKNKKARKRILENQTKGRQGKSYIGKNIILSFIDRKSKQAKLILLPKNIKQKTRIKLTDEEVNELKKNKTGRGRPKLYKEIIIGDIEFKDFIRSKIEYFIPGKNSKIFTDEAKHYNYLEQLYNHYSVQHNNVRDLDCENEFVKYEFDEETGEVIINTTNRVEGFFTHVRKTILGTHFHVSSWHLPKYLSAISFRYNTKDLSTLERIKKVLSCINKSNHASFIQLKMSKDQRESYMEGLSNFLNIS